MYQHFEDFSDNLERSVYVWQRCQIYIRGCCLDEIRDLLEVISPELKKSLHDKPLLNKAAASGDWRILALLVQLGFRKWKTDKKGRKIFQKLIQEHWCQEGREENQSTKRIEKWEENLKKGGETAAETIREMLRDRPKWVQRRLRWPAPVEATDTSVGGNISWTMCQGVESACDADTQRQLNMKQVLFKEPVMLHLYLDEEDWEDGENEDNNYGGVEIKKVRGTVRDVLESIYTTYKGSRLLFEGLELAPKHGYYVVCTGT